jgi:hypothetical protein
MWGMTTATQPRLIACSDGSWLAVSGNSAISLGVFGSNRKEAERAFQEALQARDELDTQSNA